MTDYSNILLDRQRILEQQQEAAAKGPTCEDCNNPGASCDPVMTDNKKHLLCDTCCESRRKNWNWSPPMKKIGLLNSLSGMFPTLYRQHSYTMPPPNITIMETATDE